MKSSYTVLHEVPQSDPGQTEEAKAKKKKKKKFLAKHMESESTREDKTFYVEVVHKFIAYERKHTKAYNHSRFDVPSLCY